MFKPMWLLERSANAAPTRLSTTKRFVVISSLAAMDEWNIYREQTFINVSAVITSITTTQIISPADCIADFFLFNILRRLSLFRTLDTSYRLRAYLV